MLLILCLFMFLLVIYYLNSFLQYIDSLSSLLVINSCMIKVIYYYLFLMLGLKDSFHRSPRNKFHQQLNSLNLFLHQLNSQNRRSKGCYSRHLLIIHLFQSMFMFMRAIFLCLCIIRLKGPSIIQGLSIEATLYHSHYIQYWGLQLLFFHQAFMYILQMLFKT